MHTLSEVVWIDNNDNIIIRASRSKPHTTEFYPFLGMLCIIVRPLAKCMCEMFHVIHGVGAPPPYR